ncbi:MAG: RNA 2',3'-cyclic phosphodiesterase [Bacillota bacterium]
MRCFLGLPLDDTSKKAISSLQRNLSNSISGKINWVPEENLHLTIMFWSVLGEREIKEIFNRMPLAVEGIPYQRFRPGKIGCFPDFKNPRVIWLGLEGNKESLHNLYIRCQGISQALGLPIDEKSFKPHITLARIKEAGGTFDSLPRKFPKLPEIEFNRVVFYHSILTPRGSQYSVLKEFVLKG